MRWVMFAFCGWMALLCAAAWSAEAPRRLETHPYASLGSGEELTASVSLGDVDGDGDLDALVANGRHWAQQNYVFFNDGRGFFRTAWPLSPELDTSYRAALVDFDGDGDLDVAVGNDRAPKRLYANDGRGRFEPRGRFGTLAPTRNLVVADVDGDGHSDILVTNRGAPNAIHFGDGRGGFERTRPFGTSDDSTIAVAVVDLDADGTMDLVLANRDGQGNIAVIGGERRGFGTGSDETRGVAVGDLDGDGHLDIVTANIGEPNGIYYGDGGGGFERERRFGQADGRSFAVALEDLDRDGTLDIVIANNAQPNRVYFNRDLVGLSFGDASHVSYGVSVGDVNGDGYPDVVIANSGARNVVYFNVAPKP